MKVTAVISEYNPYTRGHAYLLSRIREELNPDFVISVMSGNFVQRGECAMWDKYTRTRMALTCGLDTVIELPFAYATGSAFDFATGAVNLINSLGVVDTIAFGAETTDTSLFETVSDILVNEPDTFKNVLKTSLSEGLSFPAARQAAILACIGNMSDAAQSELDTLLSSPNNILALEYVSAIKRSGSTVGYHIIKRSGSLYNETELNESRFNSALSIRTAYTETTGSSDSNNTPDHIFRLDTGLLSAVPEECADILSGAHGIKAPVTCSMLDSYLAYAVTMTEHPEDIYGFTEGISGRLASLTRSSAPVSFNDYADALHTKDTTLASVKRALLHMIAGYTESDRALLKSGNDNSYASVLGARKSAGQLLKAISESSSCPVITKKSEALKKLRASENAEALLRLWSLDVRTTSLYNSIIFNAYQTPMENTYSMPLIMI